MHANAYVTKPVDFERFREIVHQIDDFFIGVVKLPPPPERLTRRAVAAPRVEPLALGN